LLVPEAGGRWARRLLPPEPVHRLAGDGDRIVALSPSGIFWSSDRGSSWQLEDMGLPVEEVDDLVLADGGMYALLGGGQVLRRPC
jgi:hypothetical protein